MSMPMEQAKARKSFSILSQGQVINLLGTLYPHGAFHPVDGMNGPNSVADEEERKAGQASRADTFVELILKASSSFSILKPKS